MDTNNFTGVSNINSSELSSELLNFLDRLQTLLNSMKEDIIDCKENIQNSNLSL